MEEKVLSLNFPPLNFKHMTQNQENMTQIYSVFVMLIYGTGVYYFWYVLILFRDIVTMAMFFLVNARNAGLASKFCKKVRNVS